MSSVGSEFLDSNKGVPQRTVLGPLLFSIMVNDISPADSSKSLLTKYADSLEVESLQKWSVENEMNLDLKKTWEMVVKGRTSKVPPEPISDIGRKPQLKLLGITFSTDPCNWDAHFDSMLKKATSRLYILLSANITGHSIADLTALFESLIMSIFFYGSRCGAVLLNPSTAVILINSANERLNRLHPGLHSLYRRNQKAEHETMEPNHH